MSQTTLIVLVVVIAVVVAAAAVYAWLLVRKRRALDAMTPEERELRAAKKHHEEAVMLAEKTLQTTVETWKKPLKTAEDALADAHTIGTRPLGSFAKVRLFEDHIETPQGAFRFENGVVDTTVDSARNLVGSKESVLSRAEAGVFQELVARSGRPEGAQTLYLVVETPIFVALIDVDSNDEASARQFSVSVNAAARSAGGHEEARRQAVAQAQGDLDRVRADRQAAVTAAEKELAAVAADTRRLDAANAAVQQAGTRSTSPV